MARSLLLSLTVNDLSNETTTQGFLKRDTDGIWRLLDINGRDFEPDFFIQFFSNVPEVLHVLDNAEADAAAANVACNVTYVTNLVTPLLRNDQFYASTLISVSL